MTARLQTLTALLLFAAMNAAAHDYSAGKLVVDHPWAEPALASAQSATIFLKIKNDGGEDDTLLSAATTKGLAAATAMRAPAGDEGSGLLQLRDLVIPAGGQVVFEPGGKRIVLNGLRVPLEVGVRFPVFLTFEHAGRMEIEVWVEDSDAD